MATLARQIVLLPTTGSLEEALFAQKTLLTAGRATTIMPIGDGTDSIEIGRVVTAILAVNHLPPASKVVIDVTGGKKATIATLGSIASARGYRQTYIEARESRIWPKFFFDEKLVILADMRGVIGGDDRQVAMRLMESGAFFDAVLLLEEITDQSVGAECDAMLLAAAAGFQAWQAANWETAKPAFETAITLTARPLLQGQMQTFSDIVGQAAIAPGPFLAVMAQEAEARGDVIFALGCRQLGGQKVSAHDQPGPIAAASEFVAIVRTEFGL